MSQNICTENFDNLFIQNKNWLRSQNSCTTVRNYIVVYPFWLAPATMILAFFYFWNPVRKWDTRNYSFNQ